MANAAPGATEHALAQCAGIAATDARLACYDDLAHSLPRQGGAPAPSVGPSVGSAVAPAVVPAAAPAAAPTVIPAAAAAPATAAAAMAVTAPAAPAVDPETAARNFGLSAAQLHTLDQGPKSIQAHIVKIIVDANRRGYVVLDNGQTWALTEGEMLFNEGELVTVSRAALGSFMMTSPSNHSFHVRRVK